MTRASLGPAVFLVAILAAAMALLPSQASAQADTTAPTISAIEITSDPDDNLPYSDPYNWFPGPGFHDQRGLYAIGDAIQLTVTFDEPVTVTGTPQLSLTIGSSVKAADYKNVNQDAVVFEYRVVQGDEGGIAVAANALALNGGAIRGAASNNADRSHDALTTQRGHRVDGIPPRLLKVSGSRWSNDCRDGVYKIGDPVSIVLEFSERVHASKIPNKNEALPQVRVQVGETERLASADFWRWEESYSYIIQEGDFDADGPSVPADAIVLNGGTIQDTAGNHALLNHPPAGDDDDNYNCPVDGVRPVVESLAITSDPGDDDTYGVGDKIEVTVTFSKNVSVYGVTYGGVPNPGNDHPRATAHHYPQLELDIGCEAKTAAYWSYAGAQVVFKYTVQAGDADDNGISIGANKLAMKRGWIQDDAGNNPVPGTGSIPSSIPHDAVVPHNAVPDDAGHKVAGAASPLTLHGHAGLAFDEGGELTWPEYNLPNYRVSGTEADVTWSLSGDDGHLFRLNMWQGGYGGTLKFISPPNYEDPADANRDNQYEVTVQVFDGANTAALQVTVLLRNIPFDADEVPAIVGTAQVGKTLTVDTSRMSLSEVHFGPFYWWIRSDGTTDTEITGARHDSYTLTDDDLGKTVKVRMNVLRAYTGDSNDELVSRTSEPTAAVVLAPDNTRVNTPATGAPTISGTLRVGQTLTADVSSIADADGMTNVSYSYQWVSNDGTGDVDIGRVADTATYTLTKWARGKTYKVRVSFIDDGGSREILTSSATGVVAPLANNPPTGRPTINGSARVGETLTADASSIRDADGLRTVYVNDEPIDPPYDYQWLRSDGSADADIAGATGDTYTLTAADVGHTVKVRVSFTDAAGYDEELTSAATAAVTARANNPATGAPTITGTAQVGETLTANTTGITDSDGLDDVSYNYQWLSSRDTEIYGATSSTYTLVSADVGKVIKVRVTFTDDADNEETLTSWATALVAASPNSPATGQPTISGTAQAGETLTADITGIADPDGLKNVTYGYQWLADDTDIEDATGSTYKVSDDDVGKTIRVRVSFTDDRNNNETLTSEATDAVTAKPDHLTVTLTNNPASHDGSADFTFEIRFSEEPKSDFSYQTLKLHAFQVTGGTVKKAQRLQKNPQSNIPWRITVRPDGNGDVTIVLAVTTDCNDDGAICTADGRMLSNRLECTVSGPDSAVQNSPATGQPAISGTAQAGESLTADITGINDANGLTNVSYSYQWIANDGTEDTDIEDTTGSTYELQPSDVGKTIKVRVSFTDDAGNEESLTSVATTAAVAAVPTEPLRLTVSQGSRNQELDASWQVPSSNGGSAITGYKVQWKQTTGSWDSATDVSEGTVTGTSHTITGLTGGVEYAVRVIATNDVGDGPASSEATGTPAGGVSQQNNAPTGLPTISGTAQVGETLTANTSGISDSDGLVNVSYSYQWLADESDIEGATGSGYTLTSGDQGQTIKVRVSFTDDAGNKESLTSAATAAVAAKPEKPLTASFENNPASHDGSADFTFELRFSEHIADLSYKTLRDHALTVTGGQVKKAERMDRNSATRNIHWRITVEPDGNGDVTIALPVTTDCDDTGAICTGDGRMLSNGLELTVSGPGG